MPTRLIRPAAVPRRRRFGVVAALVGLVVPLAVACSPAPQPDSAAPSRQPDLSALKQRVTAYLRDAVARAERPLLLASLGVSIPKTVGHGVKTSNWCGCGSLTDLVTALAKQGDYTFVENGPRSYIYDPARRLVDARRQIGMVFQKPNPFPAMSIYDNVVAGLKLTGRRVSQAEKDWLVETSLTKAGLWTEVRNRLAAPGGGLSGGQQQRLCIARSLAVRPRVLLMDEPCSALDPTSTRVIEDTMLDLAHEVTIVIVTHNMQQAARVSQQCAFFLAENGRPGAIVEHGDTSAMFTHPQDPRTQAYVEGRFG